MDVAKNHSPSFIVVALIFIGCQQPSGPAIEEALSPGNVAEKQPAQHQPTPAKNRVAQITGFPRLESVPQEFRGRSFSPTNYNPRPAPEMWQIVEEIADGYWRVGGLKLIGFEPLTDDLSLVDRTISDEAVHLRFESALKAAETVRHASGDFWEVGGSFPWAIMTTPSRCIGLVWLELTHGERREFLLVDVGRTSFLLGTFYSPRSAAFYSSALASELDKLLQQELGTTLSRLRLSRISGKRWYVRMKDLEPELKLEYELEEKRLSQALTANGRQLIHSRPDLSDLYQQALRHFAPKRQEASSSEPPKIVLRQDLSNWPSFSLLVDDLGSIKRRPSKYLLSEIQIYGFGQSNNHRPRHIAIEDTETLARFYPEVLFLKRRARPIVGDVRLQDRPIVPRERETDVVGVIKLVLKKRKIDDESPSGKTVIVGVGARGFYLDVWSGTIGQRFYSAAWARFLDKVLQERIGQGLTARHMANLSTGTTEE